MKTLMNKICVLLGVIICFYHSAVANEVVFNPVTAEVNHSVVINPVKEINYSAKGVEVLYSIPNVIYSNDSVSKFSIPSFGIIQRDENIAPKVSFTFEYIAIPEGCTIDLSEIKATTTSYSWANEDLDLTSSQIRILEEETPDQLTSQFVSIADIQIYRGHKIAKIKISPILYDTKSDEVIIANNLSFNLLFKEEIEGNSISRMGQNASIDSDDSLGDNFFSTCINSQSLENARSSISNANADCSYLIITTFELESALSEFIEWKKLLGYNVIVASQASWTSDEIMERVEEEYNNNADLLYLLLVGNNSMVPGINVPEIKYEDALGKIQTLKSHYTDFYYGCMDGENDRLPDIYRGRWAADNRDEVSAIAYKIMEYERNPNTENNFYSSSTHCAYFQHHSRYTEMENSRFIKTSEELRSHMIDNYELSPTRIYWDTDIIGSLVSPSKPYIYNYLGYNADFEYVPTEVMNVIEEDKSFKDVKQKIQNGSFYVLYRGHGYPTCLSSWYTYPIKPNFDIDLLNDLTNIDRLPLFFNFTCLTGDYNQRCLAQELLSKVNGGGIGVYAASEEAFSGYNDALALGVFNTIWPGVDASNLMPSFTNSTPLTRLGQILDNGMYIGMSQYEKSTIRPVADDEIVIPYLTDYTRTITHLFGDPSMDFTTNVPTRFSLDYLRRYSNLIEVNTGTEKGMISFYDHKNNITQRIYGNSASYNCENTDNVSVTISGHNKIPYVDYAANFDPEVNTSSNYIKNVSYTGNGVIRAECKISTFSEGTLLLINLFTNSIVGQVRFPENYPIASFHVSSPGVYMLSLMVGGGSPCDNKKIIVPSF